MSDEHDDRIARLETKLEAIGQRFDAHAADTKEDLKLLHGRISGHGDRLRTLELDQAAAGGGSRARRALAGGALTIGGGGVGAVAAKIIEWLNRGGS